MFNFVRLSDGGAPAGSDEMRPEVEIIATLAGMVLPPGPVDFSRLRDHAAIRAAIAAVVPGYAAIGEIDRSKAEFQIAGRTLHAPAFGTASVKRGHPSRRCLTFRSRTASFVS